MSEKCLQTVQGGGSVLGDLRWFSARYRSHTTCEFWFIGRRYPHRTWITTPEAEPWADSPTFSAFFFPLTAPLPSDRGWKKGMATQCQKLLANCRTEKISYLVNIVKKRMAQTSAFLALSLVKNKPASELSNKSLLTTATIQARQQMSRWALFIRTVWTLVVSFGVNAWLAHYELEWIHKHSKNSIQRMSGLTQSQHIWAVLIFCVFVVVFFYFLIRASIFQSFLRVLFQAARSECGCYLCKQRMAVRGRLFYTPTPEALCVMFYNT